MRRKVMRVAVGYSVIAWLLLQVAEVTFEPLHLPDWAMTLLVALAVMGFFIALVLAWAFEVTPEGVKRDTPDRRKGTSERREGRGSRRPYRSIAVLPFADMSPSKNYGYFCEGIAEEILNSLSKVRGLHVPARTSSFRFDTDALDIREIGKALNVETVLEGSLRKDGEAVRITAQLIDARDGYHIWADSYDRHIGSVFEIQKQLSEDIVANLFESMDRQQIFHPTSATRTNINAYDYYLQGQYFLYRHNRQSGEFAVDMFSKATEADPDTALGWAGLAEAHAYLFLHHEATREHCDAGMTAANEAVRLAPDSARCRSARGLALTMVGEYREADAEFERALELDSMLFAPLYHYGRSNQLQGKLEKAAEMFERASRRRPEDYQSPLLAMSIYKRLGDAAAAHDAAERGTIAAEQHLSFHPDDARALYLGSLGFLELGDREKGMEWAERSLTLDGADALTRYNVACFYAQAGDKERALTNLSGVRIFGKEFGDWMRNDPDLDPVRNDQRFQELLTAAP